MYKFAGYVMIAIVAILFEIYWFKNDKKAILSYVTELGGEIVKVQRVFWEHVYKVEYTLNGELLSKTVKFTFTQDSVWY